MTIFPRQNAEQVLHLSRYTFSGTIPGNATLAAGVQFGAIPPGALVKSCEVYVTDVVNSGTSSAINVGFTGNGTDLVSAGNISGSTGLTTTAAPIAAAKTTLQATAKTGTPLFVTVNNAGTLATAGNVTVVVSFIPDWTGGIIGQVGG